MAKDKKTADATSQPSFEDALARLEEIVRELEEGNVSLADSLQHYEEGVKLLRQSYELLQRAERRIEILSGFDAEGNPITQPLDDTATIDQAQSAGHRGRKRTAPPKPPGGRAAPLIDDAFMDDEEPMA